MWNTLTAPNGAVSVRSAPAPAAPAGRSNKATVRVLQVLSQFIGRRTSWGVTELSQALGLSKNMVYRALSTLLEQGYVVRDATGARYELGFRVLELGAGDVEEPDVRALCGPAMRQLHQLTGESVFLSIIVGRNHVTIDAVEAMLAFTDRPAGDVIGLLPPTRLPATVWKVAVNGVMAGCKPEYMPILVAIVQAMADPQYGVQHAGSTPGWEAMIILNGPIARQLGFNDGIGVQRPGNQANTSIGRLYSVDRRAKPTRIPDPPKGMP